MKSALAQVKGGEGALAIFVPDNECANNNNAPTTVILLAFANKIVSI